MISSNKEFNLICIEDKMETEGVFYDFVIWKSKDGKLSCESWHSVEELHNRGYSKAIQQYENSSKDEKKDENCDNKEKHEEKKQKDTVVQHFVNTACDIIDKIANLADSYLRGPMQMISESLLPPQLQQRNVNVSRDDNDEDEDDVITS